MARQLHVSVLTREEIQPQNQLDQRLFVLAEYTREIAAQDASAEDDKVVNVSSTVKAELDPFGRATLILEDRTLTTPVLVHIETAQGKRLWSSEKLLDGDREATKLRSRCRTTSSSSSATGSSRR